MSCVTTVTVRAPIRTVNRRCGFSAVPSARCDTDAAPFLRPATLGLNDPAKGKQVMRRLVAYDGSASARRALAHAIELHRAGDVLGLIHVREHVDGETGHLDEPCSQEQSRRVGSTLSRSRWPGTPAAPSA